MTLLQKLIVLRGLDAKKVAEIAGVGHHSVKKVLTMAPYRVKGGVNFYRTPEIRAAIAAALCLPYDHAWGPHAARHIRRYIQKEIERRAAQAALDRAAELEDRYLRAS